MKLWEGVIPSDAKPRLKEALQRLADFYQATSQPDKAAEWRKKLAASDQPPPLTNPPPPLANLGTTNTTNPTP